MKKDDDEELEEDEDDEDGEIDEDFLDERFEGSSFDSRTNFVAPTLDNSGDRQIPLEKVVEDAPIKKPEEKEVKYNAPYENDYAENINYEARRPKDREVSVTGLVPRDFAQEASSQAHSQRMNVGEWQRQSLGLDRNDEDYLIRARRKKKEESSIPGF